MGVVGSKLSRVLLALLALLVVGGVPASAQVAFDAVANSATTTLTSVTWGHTVTGANTALMVSCISTASETVSGVTYNAVAMTNQGNGLDTGDGSRVTIFSLKAPTTGANNVIATFSSNTGTKKCTAASFTGVDQTSPFGTAVFDVYSGIDTGHSHNTTNQTNGMVWDSMSIRDSVTSLAVAAGQTQRASVTFTGQILISSTKPGAATTSTGYTWDNAFSHWAHGTVPMNPVASGGCTLSLLGVGC